MSTQEDKQSSALGKLLLATAYVAAEKKTDLTRDEIAQLARDAMSDAVAAFDVVVLRREDGHLGIAPAAYARSNGLAKPGDTWSPKGK